MFLFFIGMAEMVIITLWTKYVAETKVTASTLITFVNVFVWYYVLRMVIEDINDFSVITWYALGCAAGTAISLILPTHLERYIKKLKRMRRKNITNAGTVSSWKTIYEPQD